MSSSLQLNLCQDLRLDRLGWFLSIRLENGDRSRLTGRR
jgi:hypothetical protein